MGEVSTTKTGRTCQRWSSQTPHSHDRPKWEHNHCRNPDNSPDGAWCYTTDSGTRWEYCSQIEGILFFFQIIFNKFV